MGQRISVDADDELIKKARLNCVRQGSDFSAFLTDCIKKKARETVADRDAVLHESLIVNEVWAPSRATLFEMRKSGELREGKEGDSESGYYYTKGQSIYYYLAKTKSFFKKKYPHIEAANRKKLEATETTEEVQATDA